MYTIEKAKEAIKDGVRGYLLKDEKGHYVMNEVNRLPFYLEGSPGIGKTEIVHQIAKELNLGYVSFSLVHHTRNSLLGLPVIKELENGDKYTCYTMSEIIAKVLEQVETGYQEGILLMDEFPCMSETILPAMLSFLQTKNIGTHKLPEGWVIVLCGNPPAYNKTARTFDAAIMDRIRKLEIAFEPEVFLKYGEETNMHPVILDYLMVHQENVYRYKNERKQLELVTCRGWENVSHMLKTYEILEQPVDKEAIYQYLKSEEVSAEFYQFYSQYCLGINPKCIEDILNGIRSERYVKRYQSIDYHQKWKLLDYIVDYMEKKNESLMHELELQHETERMLMELKELDAESDESDIVMLDYMDVMDIILRIDRDKVFDTKTEIRAEIIKKWFEDDNMSLDDEEIEVGAESLYGLAYKELKKWHKSQCDGIISWVAAEIGEQIARLLCFANEIDQEKSLMEMLLGRINDSDLLLNVLNRYPNETYLNLCARRYGL